MTPLVVNLLEAIHVGIDHPDAPANRLAPLTKPYAGVSVLYSRQRVVVAQMVWLLQKSLVKDLCANEERDHLEEPLGVDGVVLLIVAYAEVANELAVLEEGSCDETLDTLSSENLVTRWVPLLQRPGVGHDDRGAVLGKGLPTLEELLVSKVLEGIDFRRDAGGAPFEGVAEGDSIGFEDIDAVGTHDLRELLEDMVHALFVAHLAAEDARHAEDELTRLVVSLLAL